MSIVLAFTPQVGNPAPCQPTAVDNTATVTTYPLTAPITVIENVRTNDTPCPGDATLALVGALPSALGFDTTTGAVTLLQTATAGTYTFQYVLGTAPYTATATVTVTYTPDIPPPPCVPFVPPCACPP